LEHYNRAGTVQDFAVAVLCNLDHPIMSVQNAAGWGYFDTSVAEWNSDILQGAGFPTHLLPHVVKSGAIAGTLNQPWYGIPSGTPVGNVNSYYGSTFSSHSSSGVSHSSSISNYHNIGSHARNSGNNRVNVAIMK